MTRSCSESRAVSTSTGVFSPRARSALQDLQAVAPRQAQIEQDGVERLGIDPKERGFTGTFDDDLVLFRLEPLTQGVRDFLFVFDDQDSHL